MGSASAELMGFSVLAGSAPSLTGAGVTREIITGARVHSTHAKFP